MTKLRLVVEPDIRFNTLLYVLPLTMSFEEAGPGGTQIVIDGRNVFATTGWDEIRPNLPKPYGLLVLYRNIRSTLQKRGLTATLQMAIEAGEFTDADGT